MKDPVCGMEVDPKTAIKGTKDGKVSGYSNQGEGD